MTCACTETSRAETGSSAMISLGAEGQGAGDADALALPPGKLVGVIARLRRLQPDPTEYINHHVLGFPA